MKNIVVISKISVVPVFWQCANWQNFAGRSTGHLSVFIETPSIFAASWILSVQSVDLPDVNPPTVPCWLFSPLFYKKFKGTVGHKVWDFSSKVSVGKISVARIAECSWNLHNRRQTIWKVFSWLNVAKQPERRISKYECCIKIIQVLLRKQMQWFHKALFGALLLSVNEFQRWVCLPLQPLRMTKSLLLKSLQLASLGVVPARMHDEWKVNFVLHSFCIPWGECIRIWLLRFQ